MSTSSPNPVLIIFLAGSGFGYYHPRRWNENLFPTLDQNASTATQQAQWLADLTAYCTGTLFPHATAVGATVILFWDGFCGQEFPGYAGDPTYYPPEAPQSSKRAITALCAAHGFKAGECIRPTVRNPADGTQLYDADPQAHYNVMVTWSVADGCAAWWFDSSLKGNEGQTPLEANQFFPKAGIAAMADAHPDCEFFFEWWTPEYADIPNVWVYHDPAGTPGTAGYDPAAGYLAFDVLDDPAWDADAIFYVDPRVIPTNPTQRAALAASYARGARIFLYGGANYDMTGGGFFSDTQRADLYALWLANYPFPGGDESETAMSNDLNIGTPSGQTVYARIRRVTDNRVWNGTSFVAWLDADVATYAVPLVDQGGDYYSADFPADITEPGSYFVEYFKQLGISPAVGDFKLPNDETINWDGSAVAPDSASWATTDDIKTELEGTTNYNVWADGENNQLQADIDANGQKAVDEAHVMANLVISSKVDVPYTPINAFVLSALRLGERKIATGILMNRRLGQVNPSAKDQPTAGDVLIAKGEAIIQKLVDDGSLTEETTDDGIGSLAALSPSGGGLNDTCGCTTHCGPCLNYMMEPVLTP